METGQAGPNGPHVVWLVEEEIKPKPEIVQTLLQLMVEEIVVPLIWIAQPRHAIHSYVQLVSTIL
jgi:hypothetical protein